MALEFDEETILSPGPQPHLLEIKGKLHEALVCTTTPVLCESRECLIHQARRPSLTQPLHGGPFSSHYGVPVIEPRMLLHHDRNLYQEYNDIAEEEGSEVTTWQGIVDKRDVFKV